MKPQLKKPPFSQSLLAGFLVGLATSVAVLIFQEAYRENTAFTAGYFISPAYIFIFIPMVSALAGCLYHVCATYFQKRSSLLFIITCLLLLASVVTFTISRASENAGPLFSDFRGMYVGIETIVIILAVIFIPFFVKHPGFWFNNSL